MRIGDSKRVNILPGVRTERADAAAKAYGAQAPQPVSDVSSIMGLTDTDLTPKVRDAIMQLMAEVDRLRHESEQQQARIAYLEQLADQDTLAPIANRRAFVREMSRLISYGERYGTPSSIVYFDLNGLKQINDTHGHAAGDAALVKLAGVLLENVRESDVVGRLGGDEFGALLAHADEATATEKAQQLVTAIEAEPVEFEGHTIPIRVAWGVYTFLGDESAGEALAAADRAMYERKNAARSG